MLSKMKKLVYIEWGGGVHPTSIGAESKGRYS